MRFLILLIFIGCTKEPTQELLTLQTYEYLTQELRIQNDSFKIAIEFSRRVHNNTIRACWDYTGVLEDSLARR